MTVITGRIWNKDGFELGYIEIEDEKTKKVHKGTRGHLPPSDFYRGCKVKNVTIVHPKKIPNPEVSVFPGMTDCHTHVGDAGLRLLRKYTLEELVGPNGLKQKYLAETPDDKLVSTMKKYTDDLKRHGTTRIVDFREGGVKGSKLLREACPDAVILGRPISPEFDPNEMEELLEVADGIGLPSISDMDGKYLEQIADYTHRAGKPLAIHVSERNREDFDRVLTFQPDFLVHMCNASESDMLLCADNDLPVIICPRSNFYFGIRTPIDKLMKAGIEIGLGSDNAMLTAPSMWEEIDFTKRILSLQNLDENLAYRFAFTNGCKSLNVSRPIRGQIGKTADLIVIPDAFGSNQRYL